MSFKENAAKNIKRYRLASGLTLREAAERCGMSEANFQKYESGNMKSLDVDTAHKIASAIGTTAEELTGWRSVPLDVEDAADVALRLRNDNDMVQALKIYFNMPPDKRKHVIDSIHLLGDS